MEMKIGALSSPLLTLSMKVMDHHKMFKKCSVDTRPGALSATGLQE